MWSQREGLRVVKRERQGPSLQSYLRYVILLVFCLKVIRPVIYNTEKRTERNLRKQNAFRYSANSGSSWRKKLQGK